MRKWTQQGWSWFTQQWREFCASISPILQDLRSFPSHIRLILIDGYRSLINHSKHACDRSTAAGATQNQHPPESAPTAAAPEGIVKAQEPAGENNGTKADPRRKRPTVLRRFVFWDVVFTGVVAVFSIVQSTVGYWQWNATRDQYRAMEKQLELVRLDQRPWFRIEAVPLKELEGGEPFDFDISITNVGKSVGTFVGQCTLTVPLMRPDGTKGNGRFEDVHGTIMIDLDEEVLEKAESAVLDTTFSQIAVPGQTIKYMPGGQHPLIPEVIDLINSEKIIVVVLVVVEYSGATDGRHRTRSCFVYDPHKRICSEYLKYNYMK